MPTRRSLLKFRLITLKNPILLYFGCGYGSLSQNGWWCEVRYLRYQLGSAVDSQSNGGAVKLAQANIGPTSSSGTGSLCRILFGVLVKVYDFEYAVLG